MDGSKPAQKTIETKFNPARRAFNKMAVAGAIGGPALFSSAMTSSAEAPKIAPGIKICVQSPAIPTDDDLLFIKQLGVEHVSVGSTPELRTAEGFLQIKQRYADAGITVWNIGNTDVHNMPEVTLNLPGRDEKIEAVQTIPAQSGEGGHPLHDLRPHGQRDLDQRADRRPAELPPGNSIWRARRRRGLGRKDLERASFARPRLHRKRDLGQLHLFHQAGGPGG